MSEQVKNLLVGGLMVVFAIIVFPVVVSYVLIEVKDYPTQPLGKAALALPVVEEIQQEPVPVPMPVEVEVVEEESFEQKFKRTLETASETELKDHIEMHKLALRMIMSGELDMEYQETSNNLIRLTGALSKRITERYNKRFK